MHTPDHIFFGAGKIAFFQGKIKALTFVKAMLEGFCKVSSVIFKRWQCNDESPC
jgi:hypothetical protein